MDRRIDFHRYFRMTVGIVLFIGGCAVRADEALESDAGWRPLDDQQMAAALRSSLDEYGVVPNRVDQAASDFLSQLQDTDSDPIDAFVTVVSQFSVPIQRLTATASADPTEAALSIDPDESAYAELEVLPKLMRMTFRTWLGRTLVRERLYDEAMPVIAEVDPIHSLDPASSLFFRSVCYHALLMKKEALADLRTLLENEDDCPVRFSRVAKLMIADIKPLKEDSLDEISRLMTDVSRRLDLGRSGEKVEGQEQKIIDKLSKLIEQLEQQQQQQEQQQNSGDGGGSGDGQPSGMDESRIAGASGKGDVDKKPQDLDDRWGNLPPAERKEALQKIGQDLPTHYRDAIEAYFRKRATDR